MTMLYFIIILSIIIFIHELGHFLFAKLFGVHVYEFSLGMGPQIYKYQKTKDDTEYSIRLFLIGGYVKIAGEDELEEEDIANSKKLSSKSWTQRFIVTGAGSLFNMILAILIIFVLALTLGSVSTKPYIGKAPETYPAYQSGIRNGDLVLSINGAKVASYDELIIDLYSDQDHQVLFEVQKANGQTAIYNVKAIKEKGYYIYGISPSVERNYGFFNSLTYTSNKFLALTKTMSMSFMALITGDVDINQFSGPVGVYDMVDDQVAAGLGNVAYFIAYLSINIGFINLLPIPALDGGRILFLFIEKIRRKKTDPKIEATCHYIGFLLLMALILLITYNDIFR